MYDERERKRKEEQRKGAAVLAKQIADREAERLRDEELRDRERLQVPLRSAALPNPREMSSAPLT